MSRLFLFLFRDAYHISTYADTQCFLQSVQAILTPLYPIWGRGMETNSSDQCTPPFSCVLCPMTRSHTSWKIYTETLTNFEGKFRNTYLFWVAFLFEGDSFVWKYTKCSNYGALHEIHDFLSIPVVQETKKVNLYQQEIMSSLNPVYMYLLTSAS